MSAVDPASTAEAHAVYDEHVAFYLEFVDRALEAEPSLFREMLRIYEQLLAGRLDDAVVCDIACGEGFVSRHLASRGAREVVGVDLSRALVDVARTRCREPNVSFRVDDARVLGSLPDASVDVAVCQMALMDIANHLEMFTATHRVLRPGGAFAFSLLHPCFESPFVMPEEEPFLTGDDGVHVAVVVRRYAQEGHWVSGGSGVRGHVGSYHRMLSTYMNDLVATGFVFERLVEPVFDVPGVGSQVPRVAMVLASRP